MIAIVLWLSRDLHKSSLQVAHFFHLRTVLITCGSLLQSKDVRIWNGWPGKNVYFLPKHSLRQNHHFSRHYNSNVLSWRKRRICTDKLYNCNQRCDQERVASGMTWRDSEGTLPSQRTSTYTSTYKQDLKVLHEICSITSLFQMPWRTDRTDQRDQKKRTELEEGGGEEEKRPMPPSSRVMIHAHMFMFMPDSGSKP